MSRFGSTVNSGIALFAALVAVGGCERRTGPTAAEEPSAESRSTPTVTPLPSVAAQRPTADSSPAAAAPTGDGTSSTSAIASPSQQPTGDALMHLPMNSEAMRRIQRHLMEKGHDPGPIDGIMGPKTRAALRSFQRAHVLKANGVLDQRTAAALAGKEGVAAVASSGAEASSGPAAAPTQPTK